MTNTENRDFCIDFSAKSHISNQIMVNCSEFMKLKIRFHPLLAAQISGWRARCHIEMKGRIKKQGPAGQRCVHGHIKHMKHMY